MNPAAGSPWQNVLMQAQLANFAPFETQPAGWVGTLGGPLSLLPLPQQAIQQAVQSNVAPRLPLPREFVAGPIRAFRLWRIRPGTGHLFSLNDKRLLGIFVPQPAVCVPSYSGSMNCCGDAPSARCGCGYHTLRDPAGLGWSSDSDTLTLLFEAAVWGKTIAHEHGYRSRYIWPMRVLLPTPMPGFLRPAGLAAELAAIERNYGCRAESWAPNAEQSQKASMRD